MSASTAFVDLLAALRAHALLHPPLAGGRVECNRMPALPRERDCAVVLRLLSAAGRRGASRDAPSDWTTELEIELYHRAGPGEDPIAAIDPLLEATYGRFAEHALALPSVMSVMLDPAVSWDIEEADRPLVAVVLRLQVQHRTLARTLQSGD